MRHGEEGVSHQNRWRAEVPRCLAAESKRELTRSPERCDRIPAGEIARSGMVVGTGVRGARREAADARRLVYMSGIANRLVFR
jgi:hypothetical protein